MGKSCAALVGQLMELTKLELEAIHEAADAKLDLFLHAFGETRERKPRLATVADVKAG